MPNINVNELTKEQIAKAMACETAEELMAAAKVEGIELTKDEAEAYMAEMVDFELDEATLKQAAGGSNLYKAMETLTNNTGDAINTIKDTIRKS